MKNIKISYLLPAALLISLNSTAENTSVVSTKEKARTTTEGDSDIKNLVCCETYGLGAMMMKCCETYQWTKPDECVSPEGLVGGGKQIVDPTKCK